MESGDTGPLYAPISTIVSLVSLIVWTVVLGYAIHWHRTLRTGRTVTVAVVVLTLVLSTAGLTVSALVAWVIDAPVNVISTFALGIARGALLAGSVAALVYYLRVDEKD